MADTPNDAQRAHHAHHDAHQSLGHDHSGADELARCDEALAELYTFLDGELTEWKREKIQHHLDDCSPCLEVYDFEAELRIVIKHRCQDQVPDTLRQKVADKLAALDPSMFLPPSSATGADAPT